MTSITAAAAAGRRRKGARDEPDRRRDSSGDAEAYGLANRVVPDHELFDTAFAWARKLAGQAPIAVEQVKLASDDPDLAHGIEAETKGFATAFQSEDGREGIRAFLGKRSPKWQGK